MLQGNKICCQRHQQKKEDMKAIASVITLIASVSLIASAADKVGIDPAIKAYTPVAGISGNLNAVGSDTLNNLMTLWGEAFRKKYPSVKIGIEGKGSATAPPALAAGTAQLGPMSRPMKAEEIAAFKSKFGYEPTAIKVSLDAVAFYVNKDNPLEGISLQQLDAIFSSTFKRGGSNITKWGEVKGAESMGTRAIALYGRNSASGTNGFVKEHALKKGDFKDDVKEQPGSSAVVQAVGADVGAIGYSGIGYITSNVKVLSVAEKGGATAVQPSYANCISGRYPLSRYLLIYVNKKPGQPLDALTKEFIKFVVSKDGQEIVAKDGYYPLPAKAAAETAKAVE